MFGQDDFKKTINLTSSVSKLISPTEVITTGGEEQFVGEIVRESIKLGTQVLWYTSMLGRKTSLDHILGMLSESGVKKVAVTEFKQGL